jgi:hypothetical protein
MATLLLLVALAARPGVQVLAISAVPTHPAGCHSHLPAKPAPASYQCCVNGHHAAIPSPTFSPRPLVAQILSPDGEKLSIASVPSLHSATLVFPGSSPPGFAPLRI